jgi:hypothetical protein
VTTWNQEADIGLIFKGLFRINDGIGDFEYDLLQEATITTTSDNEKFYSATGTKLKKAIGDSSTWEIRIKKTADLWATGSPPYTGAASKTISAFQTDIINNRVVPELTFEGVQETEAASNEFVHVRFVGFIENIEDTRNPATGAPEVVMSGEIKSLTNSHRTAVV